MDVKPLNFFQKQYLTFFKNKVAKDRAAVYHELIRFVLEEQYAPSINDLLKKFPTREKSLINDLRYLEIKKLLIKFKVGVEFRFCPVLCPFVILKESQEEVYTAFSDSPQYERGIRLRDKVNEILDARKQFHKQDWRESFKSGGYSDDERPAAKKTADDYDRGELPPNFDDAENRSGMVVV